MSGAVLNSPFLMRPLTSGEEDIERMLMLNEDISSTALELTMLIFSISATFNLICLSVRSLFTKFNGAISFTDNIDCGKGGGALCAGNAVALLVFGPVMP